MNSGNEIIKILGKHGLRGSYFSYKQYSQLSRIQVLTDAKALISSWGYDVTGAKSASEVVERLEKTGDGKYKKGCLASMILEPLFWLFLILFSGC